jgi:serine/threonine protein kinase
MTHYMLTRAFPFQIPQEWATYRQTGTFSSNALEAHNITLKGHDFVRSLTTFEPTGRPSASDALQHTWLKVLLRDTLPPSRESQWGTHP